MQFPESRQPSTVVPPGQGVGAPRSSIRRHDSQLRVGAREGGGHGEPAHYLHAHSLLRVTPGDKTRILRLAAIPPHRRLSEALRSGVDH